MEDEIETGKRTYPKPRRGKAMKEFQKSLSRRMCAFFVPIRDTSSTVCWGVKASMMATILVGRC